MMDVDRELRRMQGEIAALLAGEPVPMQLSALTEAMATIFVDNGVGADSPAFAEFIALLHRVLPGRITAISQSKYTH